MSNLIHGGDAETPWQIVIEHAESEDQDLRAAIACMLLEELLDEYFDEYFPRLRELVKEGSPRVIEVARMCWIRDIEGRQRKLDNLLTKAQRGRPH